MKIFITGGTGTIGKSLLPLLTEKKHEVVALVRSVKKIKEVEETGAKAIIADVLNKKELTSIIKKVEPEVIINQLTALSNIGGSFKNFDKVFELTNRFRTEVNDTLLHAANLTGVRRFITQSFCGWPFARKGGRLKTEEDPLDADPPKNFSKTLNAIAYLENAVKRSEKVQAFALRYGIIYGKGTIAKGGQIVEMIRKRKVPIVGNGAGIWSFIHVNDAAVATEKAVTLGTPGIYNIVDDEPVEASIWLPYLAQTVGAKPPRKIPAGIARLLIGEGGVMMMTEIRGGLNRKAKQELSWQPFYSSWQRGFLEGLS